MLVGVMYVEMHLPSVTSLKGKRQIVQSIKAGIRNKFNVSISEVDYQDLWQRCALGVAGVSGERAPLDRDFQNILKFINSRHDLEVTQHNIEYV